jgi:hypothetical protein
MKIEAICSSETSVVFQRTTRRYITEDGTILNSDTLVLSVLRPSSCVPDAPGCLFKGVFFIPILLHSGNAGVMVRIHPVNYPCRNAGRSDRRYH